MAAHFRRFEIPNRPLGRLLKRNLQHLGTLQSRERFLRGNEAKEAPQRGQPAVPRNDGRPARLLDVLQEGCHLGAIQIVEAKRCDLDLLSFSDETEKQPPSIAVCQDRPMRRIALLSQPFVEERVQQFGQ